MTSTQTVTAGSMLIAPDGLLLTAPPLSPPRGG